MDPMSAPNGALSSASQAEVRAGVEQSGMATIEVDADDVVALNAAAGALIRADMQTCIPDDKCDCYELFERVSRVVDRAKLADPLFAEALAARARQEEFADGEASEPS